MLFRRREIVRLFPPAGGNLCVPFPPPAVGKLCIHFPRLMLPARWSQKCKNKGDDARFPLHPIVCALHQRQHSAHPHGGLLRQRYFILCFTATATCASRAVAARAHSTPRWPAVRLRLVTISSPPSRLSLRGPPAGVPVYPPYSAPPLSGRSTALRYGAPVPH